jgi:hypothetical protein
MSTKETSSSEGKEVSSEENFPRNKFPVNQVLRREIFDNALIEVNKYQSERNEEKIGVLMEETNFSLEEERYGTMKLEMVNESTEKLLVSNKLIPYFHFFYGLYYSLASISNKKKKKLSKLSREKSGNLSTKFYQQV